MTSRGDAFSCHGETAGNKTESSRYSNLSSEIQEQYTNKYINKCIGKTQQTRRAGSFADKWEDNDERAYGKKIEI